MPKITITINGTVVRTTAVFTDLLGDLDTPDIVALSFNVDNGPATTYVYGIDDEIVLDSVGTLHCDLDSTGMAPQRPVILTCQWASRNVDQDPAVQVVGVATARINPSALPLVFSH